MLFDLFKSAFKGGNFWLIPRNIMRTFITVERVLRSQNPTREELIFVTGYVNALHYIQKDKSFINHVYELSEMAARESSSNNPTQEMVNDILLNTTDRDIKDLSFYCTFIMIEYFIAQGVPMDKAYQVKDEHTKIVDSLIEAKREGDGLNVSTQVINEAKYWYSYYKVKSERGYR